MRRVFADFLRSKPVEIFLIVLIIAYTFMVFVFFGLEDIVFEENEEAKITLYLIELAILGLFVIEITLYFFSYRCLYFSDIWNVFDLVVIVLSIAFVMLDLKF